MSVSQLTKNIFVSFIAQGLLLVLSFFSMHIIFNRLGSEVLGLTNFSLLITSFVVGLFDLGITLVATREIAAYRITDPEYTRKIIGFLAFTSICSFTVAVSMISVFSPILLVKWAHIESINVVSTGLLAFILMSVGLLCGVLRTHCSVILSGYERIDLLQSCQVAFTFLQQVGIIVVSYYTKSFLFLSTWYFISGILGMLIFAYSTYRVIGTISFKPAFDLTFLRKNHKFIASNFLNACVGTIIYSSDKWVISRLLPISTLGIYTAAQGVAGKAMVLPNSILGAAFARLSALAENAPIEEWYVQYKKMQDLTLIIGITCVSALFFASDFLLGRILSFEAARQLQVPFGLMCIGQIFHISLLIPGWVAIAQKRVGIHIKVNSLTAALTVPFMVIGVMQFGLIGASVFSLISALIHYILFIPYFSRHCVKRPISLWYTDTGKIIFTGLLLYGGVWYSASMVSQSIVVMSIAYLAASILFIWLMYFCVSRRLFQIGYELLVAVKGRIFSHT